MRKRFYFLKKPKVRQSWNKYNLYNLSRMVSPDLRGRTFFQQKWTAKAETRAYHGEQVLERQWRTIFSRRLPAVVSMEARYLAQHDGSEHATGRGSGLDVAGAGGRVGAGAGAGAAAGAGKGRGSDGKRKGRRGGEKEGAGFTRMREDGGLDRSQTPYSHMVYFPLERRLDVAVFRALFASSARQARQFVVHGFVKVNGQRMRHPSYMLNPGDLFQVEPERVMFATGASKDAIRYRQKADPPDLRRATPRSSADVDQFEAMLQGGASTDAGAGNASDSAASPAHPTGQSTITTSTAPTTEHQHTPADTSQEAAAAAAAAKKAIKALIQRTAQLLEDPTQKLRARRKQELRGFKRTVVASRAILGRLAAPDEQIARLQAQLDAIAGAVSGGATTGATTTAGVNASAGVTAGVNASSSVNGSVNASAVGTGTGTDAAALAAALARVLENPPDASKPYATPWRPRDYMSAFAFIPRYLEVNPSVCAAVYVRHPVARPGLAEVPTPFTDETSQLAFSYYLRSR